MRGCCDEGEGCMALLPGVRRKRSPVPRCLGRRVAMRHLREGKLELDQLLSIRPVSAVGTGGLGTTHLFLELFAFQLGHDNLLDQVAVLRYHR